MRGERDNAGFSPGVVALAIAFGAAHDVAPAVYPGFGDAVVANVGGDVSNAAGCGFGQDHVACVEVCGQASGSGVGDDCPSCGLEGGAHIAGVGGAAGRVSGLLGGLDDEA